MIELPKRARPDTNADINIVPYIDVMLGVVGYLYDDNANY